MKLSVSTWSAHEQLLSGALSKLDFVKLLNKHGITGMEAVEFDFADSSFESMKELCELGKEYGVDITCMSLEHDLCQYTEEDRQADVDKVFAWMETAKKLNVKTVRVFTGWLKECVPYYIQMDWVYEGMKKIVKKAEELDLDLVLENHDDVCFGAEEIIDLIGEMDTTHMYTCPDVFNYKMYTPDRKPIVSEWSYQEIEKLLPYAKNAHMKISKGIDGNTRDLYVDVARMRKMFEQYHYDGPVALEFMWPLLDKDEDAVAELENAMEVLKYQLGD